MDFMKAGYVLGVLCTFVASTVAQVTPTEANLRAGITAGGTITFNGDGVIALTSPIIVFKDVVIDATGHSVIIDGQNTNRLFEVVPGVRFSMTNLVLANGRKQGRNDTDMDELSAGESVSGGALLNNGGIVTAVDCTFTNNAAIGGKGFVPPGTIFVRSAGGSADG